MKSSEPKEFRQCGDKSYESGRHDSQKGWYNFVGKNLSGSRSVLDVGCGLGKSHGEFFAGGASYVLGIDIDPRTLLNKKICGQHEYKYMSIEEIPNSSFSLVTVIDVIEHIVEDITFFQELVRCAQKEIFITTPNYWHTQNSWPYHCREYKPGEFTHLCTTYSPPDATCWFYGSKDPNGYDLIVKRESLVDYEGPHIAALGCHITL